MRTIRELPADAPVREVPIRPRTEKPKWRGVVKLQVETMPKRGGSYLVTDRAGELLEV